MEAETIRALLVQGFPGATELAVEDRTGTGDHFQVTVVSSDFDGLALIDQHRRVNDVGAAPRAAGSLPPLRHPTQGTARSPATSTSPR